MDVKLAVLNMTALPERLNASQREFWRGFIKMYEQMPELWDSNHPDYRNKELKNDSYEILQIKLSEIQPNATKNDVGRRINIFRTNYRREQMRLWRQQDLGLPPKLCKPTLWFYDEMSFLLSQDSFRNRGRKTRASSRTPKRSFTPDVTLNISSDIYPLPGTTPVRDTNSDTLSANTYPNSAENSFCDFKADGIIDPLDITPSNEIAEPADNMNQQDTVPETFDESLLLSPKLEMLEDPKPMVIDDSVESPHMNESMSANHHVEASVSNFQASPIPKSHSNGTDHPQSSIISESTKVLAKSWAIQYEEMSPNQRILARKAIADVLFEGCLGNLRINRGDRTIGNNV